MLLSARFPEVRFSGVELTAAGVQAAKQVVALPELPPEIQQFAVEPLQDLTAHRRLDVRQASAAQLPFADGSFDLVYTSLALEQMEEIRDTALSEVARVARDQVAMIEPFRDWNAEGLRHDYVVSRDIFSARISDLPRFGLTPALVVDDIPHKITLGAGLVVATKQGRVEPPS